jgi:hypothetical protein
MITGGLVGDIEAAKRLIESLAPGHREVTPAVPLESDECRWFLRAVADNLVAFTDCPQDCFRRRKWNASGPDHFVTPSGRPRHLFSKPVGHIAWLNREYVPHLAAFAFAIIDRGYPRDACSFSLYRTFARDRIVKRAGQAYETDAEFYDPEGSITLQIEAKASPKQTAALAASVERHGRLADLPPSTAKEIEYVLDLAPQHLWVVGPGSIDPPAHVYRVQMLGNGDAALHLVSELPAA